VPRFTLAPHLARSLLRQPGQQLATTIDAATQRGVLNALNRVQPYNHPQNASVIVIDNASGEVLAWVGALQARDADGLLAREPLSQWWLPYAAELGIELRSHTSVSLLIDARSVLDAKDARAGHSATVLSLRAALQSHNIGALREQAHELTKEIGTDAFNDRLRQLGLDAPASIDGLAGETSLIQLAGAWHGLSTGTGYVPVSALPPDTTTARKIVAPAAAFITQDMLADNFAGGWRSSWATSSPDGHQQLVVGNTDRLTVLVSVTRREKADDLARSAQQLWKDVISNVQKDPSHSPMAPESITSSIVVFEPPDEAVRRDWFIKGTELDRVMAEALPSGARIKVPGHGQVYILNIPTQPWTLEAAIAKATRWQVDGDVIGQGTQATWVPSLGHHRVVLLGPRDEVLDTADFEVIAPH
jgi:penicillin-binding protein 1C